MDKDKMEQNKARFLELCRTHIQREGLEELLAYLEKTDFYVAPSSTGFHLNEDGGLCQHSINVFEAAKNVYDHLLCPHIADGTATTDQEIPVESLAIACLFHDLCKTNLYHKTERWRKDEGGRWQSYEGYEVQDNFPFGHGEKSCIIIHWYMKLHQDELLAIRWHMGMFDMGEQGSNLRYSYRAAMEKYPLVSLVQVADMLASNCLEKTVKR